MTPAARSRIGFLAAMIALICQMAVGGMAPADQPAWSQIAALSAVDVLCSGVAVPDGHAADHHKHRRAPAICPIAVSFSAASFVLTPPPMLPAPADALLSTAARDRPPGRGPPPAATRVGAPRAPPLSA